MTTDDDYSFEGCRSKLDDARQLVRDQETAYETAIKNAADSEAFYRTKLAAAFRRHREGGAAVEAAHMLARGECSVHSHQRDTTAGLVRLAAERLENARDSRRSLWRLIEWARDRDLVEAARQNGGQTSG